MRRNALTSVRNGEYRKRLRRSSICPAYDGSRFPLLLDNADRGQQAPATGLKLNRQNGVFTILVYGTEWPLGKRIRWYLQELGDHYEIPLGAIEGRPWRQLSSIKNVHRDVQNTYVGTFEGTPNLIVAVSPPTYRRAANPSVRSGSVSGISDEFTIRSMIAAHLALAARAADIPMVYVTNDSVFSGQHGPYDDYDTPESVDYPVIAGESAAQALHPRKHNFGGSTVVRVPSALYGKDITEGPGNALLAWQSPGNALLAWQRKRDKSIVTNVRVRPTFVGDVAYRIAFNLLRDPHAFHSPVLHLGSSANLVTWPEFAKSRGLNPTDLYHQVSGGYGTNLALNPSTDWGLSRNYETGWRNFQTDLETASYVRYW